MISSKTSFIALIGYPVCHSLSPIMQNAALQYLGLDLIYIAVHCKNRDLEFVLNSFKKINCKGLNITIPHKENIMEFLDEINPRAESIGSVNCIIKSNSRIIGNNTDWYGFSLALKTNKIDVFDKEVIVLGAGGTSKSILYSLKQLSVKKIILLNRTLQKARALQNEIIISNSP